MRRVSVRLHLGTRFFEDRGEPFFLLEERFDKACQLKHLVVYGFSPLLLR
jgi:hypothetical protein